MKSSAWVWAVVACCAVALPGCGEPRLPALLPVSGVVLLDGKPLPNAEVRFQPSAAGLPGDASGVGVTDAEGRFQLSTAGKPGAIAGDHVVMVLEGPPPEETRGDSAEAQMAASEHMKSLPNRPIPAKYTSLATSDCRITVKEGQAEYEVKLSR